MAKKKTGGVPEYLDTLVRELCESAPRAMRDGDEEATHRARVATRRLTAAVRCFKPVLSKDHRRPFQKALRSVRRSLGRARDLDVMVGHLAPLAKHPTHGGATRSASDWLAGERQRLRAEVRDDPSINRALRRIADWGELREELREADAVGGLAALLSQEIPLQLHAFADAAGKLAAPGPEAGSGATADTEAAAGAVAGAARHGQDPHEVRIDAKLLRYSLELAGAAGIRLPGGVLKRFKRMQDALGEWHDEVVLAQQVLSLALERELAVHCPDDFEGHLRLAELFWRRSAKSMKRFRALWIEGAEALVQGVTDALPRPSKEACAPASGEGPKTTPDDPPAAAPDASPASDEPSIGKEDVIPGQVTVPEGFNEP